jgi:hypothetical protein
MSAEEFELFKQRGEPHFVTTTSKRALGFF